MLKAPVADGGKVVGRINADIAEKTGLAEGTSSVSAPTTRTAPPSAVVC